MAVSRKVHVPVDAPALPYEVVELVDRGPDFELLLEQAKGMQVCSVDSETTSNFDEKIAPYKDWVQGARAFMATFCASDDRVFATYDPGIVADILLYLEDEQIRSIYQNLKFDFHHFREWVGYIPSSLDLLIDDTMHGFRLAFPGQKAALKVASQRYVRVSADYYQTKVMSWLKAEQTMRAEGSLFQGHVKVEQPNFSDVPRDLMLPYAAHDAYLTLMSWYGLKTTKVFEMPIYQNELKLAQLLVRVEKCGWHVKSKEISRQHALATKEFETATKTWGMLAPEVDWKSNVEVGDFFYGQVGEPVVFFTDNKAPSTSEAAILKFERNPTLRDTLLACRRWKKSLDVLENLRYYTGDDGNVHTNLGQEKAITGRFGSDHANLQNIPVFVLKKPWTHARACFGPEDSEYEHLFGDYKQIEMVLFAEYVNDPNLNRAIIDGDDLHSLTASRMFGLDPTEVEEEPRSLGKKMNFTMIYLAGVDKIAAGLENGDKGEGVVTFETIENTLGRPGTHKELAKWMTDRYHLGYPSVRPWIKELIRNVERRRPTPYIINKFGRKIPVDQGYEYKAVNYLIQGSAADLMKHAMIRSWAAAEAWCLSKGWTPWKDVQLFVTIHDDLGWKVPSGYAAELASVIKGPMCDFTEFKLPIRVDFSRVTHEGSWALKEKIKVA
jgi:DNA polymerase I-like protein with 3'-5' exonuclease and polymerase domains